MADESELMAALIWVLAFSEMQEEWMFEEQMLFAEEVVEWGSGWWKRVTGGIWNNSGIVEHWMLVLQIGREEAAESLWMYLWWWK